jgi:2-(1,2-epoxy-1,2-dihydrophenyl)acetyl-CoA isomerase
MAEGNAGGLDVDGSFFTLVNTMRHGTLASQLLHEMPKPTIAAINGACAGAGLALACAADLRYCAQGAVFNTAFARAGVSGDFGGSWSLPRIVGPAKARELYLLAERFDATEAQRIGLVSGTFPDSEFETKIAEVTNRLMSLAPLALRSIKKNMNESFAWGFSEALDREAVRHIELGFTEDSTEAAKSFLEKRPPAFLGR